MLQRWNASKHGGAETTMGHGGATRVTGHSRCGTGAAAAGEYHYTLIITKYAYKIYRSVYRDQQLLFNLYAVGTAFSISKLAQ